MATPSPLQIAVIGVGGIGSTFAFQLARVGQHHVTAVARPGSPRLAQLQRNEGIVNTRGEHAKIRVAEALDPSTPYDLVIVTLMAHQLSAVLPALQASAAQCIQFMFNNFNPEHLRDAVGAERCTFGMPFVQATVGQDGKLQATVGAGGQQTLMEQQRWVDVFRAAGLPATVELNMPLWLRCHAPMCVAFESISAAGMRRGGGASWGEAMTLSRGVHESFLLIKRMGYEVYPASKARLNGSPMWVLAAVLWGMSRVRSFRELLATGEHEGRALADTMVSAASKVTPPVAVAAIQAMKLS